MIARLPRRDYIAIVGAIVGVCLLCWWYLVDMAGAMSGMEMSGMEMSGMEMSGMAMGIPQWDAGYFLMMFLMWAIMMVGMMLPSVTPAVLIYAGIERKARAGGQVIAPTGLFVLGYLLMWVYFSICATLLQWVLDEAALLSTAMATNSAALGAGILIAAGVYQWLPIKDACLRHCRGPVHFISQHWRPGAGGAVWMGMYHGSYCLGCCWVLMGLLFFGGVMNLVWITGITLFVLLEKVLDLGRYTSRLSGLAMILSGAFLLWSS